MVLHIFGGEVPGGNATTLWDSPDDFRSRSRPGDGQVNQKRSRDDGAEGSAKDVHSAQNFLVFFPLSVGNSWLDRSGDGSLSLPLLLDTGLPRRERPAMMMSSIRGTRPVKAYKRMNAQIESAIAAIREWEAPTPVRESHM